MSDTSLVGDIESIVTATVLAYETGKGSANVAVITFKAGSKTVSIGPVVVPIAIA